MIERFSRGQVARLRLDLISAGAGSTGEAPTVAIQRANGSWFRSSDSSWQVAIVNNAMAETDAVNLPGRYHFDFDQSLDLVEGSISYAIKIVNSTTYLEYRDIEFAPLSAAAAPDLCSIQGTIFSMSGEPVKNSLVRATLTPVHADALGRGIEANRVVTTYSDVAGAFQLPLVRGTTVRFEIDAIGYDRKFVVPDEATANFAEL